MALTLQRTSTLVKMAIAKSLRGAARREDEPTEEEIMQTVDELIGFCEAAGDAILKMADAMERAANALEYMSVPRPQ